MRQNEPCLRDFVSRAYIISYQEDIAPLKYVLESQGFECISIRQEFRERDRDYSGSYLCLRNHARAWQEIVATQETVAIFEADFVPVRQMGNRPIPCDLQRDQFGKVTLKPFADLGIAWLYTCAAQVYSVSETGKAIGYSSSMVAYLISPQAAEILLQHAENIHQKFGPKTYSVWDSQVESVLRSQGLQSYIPFRNYGEHGGHPNREHYLAKLSREHRADVLYASLTFIPQYCYDGSYPVWFKYWLTRIFARIKGLGRLIFQRYARSEVWKQSSHPHWIIGFAILRQFTLRL